MVPWAAVVVTPEDRVLAAASPMFHGGLFWRRVGPGGRELRIASDPGPLLRGAPRAEIDADYVIDYLAMRPPTAGTPYRGIGRLDSGSTFEFGPGRGAPERSEWCGVEAWRQPFREGPGTASDYLRTFDAAVDDAVPPSGPLVVALSGGLDSTFLAASLVRHASAQRPVVGLVHRPVAGVPTLVRPAMVADDWPYAKALARKYPGLIELEAIRNDAGLLGLDVALAESRRGRLPVLNQGNSVWIDALRMRALAAGAEGIFLGSTGNYSYSHPHSYAFVEALHRRQWAQAAAEFRRDATARGGRAAALRAAAQVSARWRHRDDGTLAYTRLLHMRRGIMRPERPDSSRGAYLDAMAEHTTSFMGAANPAASRGLLGLDPFESESVLRFAAEMTPREWRRVPTARGYARMLAEGRVPDEIRLRQHRGAQAADAWWVTAQHRRRYLDEAEALRTTPVLRDMIDVNALAARLRGWPWEQPAGPEILELLAMDRLLHMGAFLRDADSNLG